MKNRPPYAIDSVDHALRLALLLQQEGSLRVSEAADRLGVSRSTAHRLLAMLVYRDFAEQDDERRYRAGSALRPTAASSPAAVLRRVALPHLQALATQLRETANLQVRVGTQVRFVATVECDQVLRVGDRVGRILPAHLVSGGKALLAGLPADALTDLYAGAEHGDVDLAKLRRELSLVRKRGFAINNQATEAGITAIGVAIPAAEGEATAALSLAMPSARFDRDRLPAWVSALSAAAAAVERDFIAQHATA